MPLEERGVLHNKVYSANKVWKDVRARACRQQCSRLQKMFHVALINVSWLQALEVYFLWDVVQTFCALIQAKYEYQIQYCFQFSALNQTVKMSNETWFSIMKFIYSPLQGIWLVHGNLDLMNLCMYSVHVYEEVLSITKYFHGPSNSKAYWKELWYNLVLTSILCQSFDHSLYQSSTVVKIWHCYSIFLSYIVQFKKISIHCTSPKEGTFSKTPPHPHPSGNFN